MSVFGDNKRKAVPKLKVLIYGAPGSGKTHFAINAPKVKVLHVLTEKQGEATIGIVDRNGGMNADSESITVTDMADLYAKMRVIRDNIAAWNVIVVDTIDDIEDMIGRDIAKAKNGRSIEEVDEFNRSRGTRDAMLQGVINFFRDIEIHVIVLAHVQERNVEKKTQQGKDITTYIEPRLVGKHAVSVTMQKFNAVGLLTKHHTPDGDKRAIRFRGTSNQALKDLPYFADVEEANLETLLKKHQDFYRTEESAQKGK